MKNFEIVKIFREVALYLEMDDVPFKPRAYDNAARSIEVLDQELEEIYAAGGVNALVAIPKIGRNLAEKIEELLVTGKLIYYEELKRKIPVDLECLSSIAGIGPKTIKLLYQKLNIKTLDDLEEAARTHKIAELSGFKEKSEQNILKGIAFARKTQGRYILGFTLPFIRDIERRLTSLSGVKQVVIAGSARRMKETIGDVDFLVISDTPTTVMDFFVSMPEVIDVIGKGETKSSIKLTTGMNADIRVLSAVSFGSALQYFTGSRDHNIALRQLALEKGLKLSEYGLFKGDHQIAGQTEEEIYTALGLSWIPPELRENTGEIEAARKNQLPHVLDYHELKGDLQVHTTWTDGTNSIVEMAEEAQTLGLEYIVVSDHARALTITGGLDEQALIKQGQEIDKINSHLEGIQVLKGVELNISRDGRVDLSNKILKQLDVVSAAVHSYFTLSKDEMTQRVLKAIENPNIDMLCHPTTRQIQKREAIQIDMDQIITSAKETGTILDIDAYPDRLDLKDEFIRKAVEIGAKLGISSDSHSKTHLRFLEFGIAQARRGWATASDIVNTRTAQNFLQLTKT